MCEDGKRWKRFGGRAKRPATFRFSAESDENAKSGRRGRRDRGGGGGQRHHLTERMKVTRMPSLAGEVQEVGEEGEGSQPRNNSLYAKTQCRMRWGDCI